MEGKTKKSSGYSAPETAYRQLNGLNQSMLKTFDEDIGKFYQEFILGNPKKEKESSAMNIGSLVDFILLDCGGEEHIFEQRMGEKFALYDGVRSSAQGFDLADELFKITMEYTNDEGVVSVSFEDRFKYAFSNIQAKEKYKGKTWEKGLEDFNKVAKEYFNKKLENIGKIVVDSWEMEKAKNVVEQAKGDEFHGALVNMETGGDVEVIDKLAVEFNYKGWACKMEQDRTIIHHNKKLIRRLDYKANYDNEEFSYAYLKRKHYLQNSFYHIGTNKWAEANGMGDYMVGAMEFLVFDTSINNRRPLKYDTNHIMLDEGKKGFFHRGKKYKGVDELMKEISWANENGIWNISEENYANKGVIDMSPYNEENE